MAVAAGESQKQPGHPRGSVERRWWVCLGGHKDPDTHGEDGQVTWGQPPQGTGDKPLVQSIPTQGTAPCLPDRLPVLLRWARVRNLQPCRATPCLGKEATPAKLPTLSTGAMKTETPVRMKTARPVSLCSLWVAAQVSQMPGVLGSPPPHLPSWTPGSLLFAVLMATGKGVSCGEIPKTRSDGQHECVHVPVPWPHSQGIPQSRAQACCLPDAQELRVLARG